MALWSVRQAGGTRAGLTVYQLQQLISTGQVVASDEVSENGTVWRRVLEVPALARALPEQPANGSGSEQSSTVEVNGVVLQRGPDGKLVPPPPEVIAQMLALDPSNHGQRAKTRARQVNRVLLVAMTIVLGVLLLLLWRQVMVTHALRE